MSRSILYAVEVFIAKRFFKHHTVNYRSGQILAPGRASSVICPPKARSLRMEKKTYSVPAISCGHCVRAIVNELEDLPGVGQITGDADGKTVTVSFEAPATPDLIQSKLAEIGYPAAALS